MRQILQRLQQSTYGSLKALAEIFNDECMVGRAQSDTAEMSAAVVFEGEGVRFYDCLSSTVLTCDEHLEGLEIATLHGFENTIFL